MYYFAYGSNMDWEQMRCRCPSSKFIAVARLDGYRFAIGRHSRLRDCGTATIIADSSAAVWGTVYDLSRRDLLNLDRFEDGYRREEISVAAANGARFEAWVYIAEAESCVPLPNPAYKRRLLSGASHWNLPDAYRAMLEQIKVSS